MNSNKKYFTVFCYLQTIKILQNNHQERFFLITVPTTTILITSTKAKIFKQRIHSISCCVSSLESIDSHTDCGQSHKKSQEHPEQWGSFDNGPIDLERLYWFGVC